MCVTATVHQHIQILDEYHSILSSGGLRARRLEYAIGQDEQYLHRLCKQAGDMEQVGGVV